MTGVQTCALPIFAQNPTLRLYRVTLHEEPGDKFTLVFDCYAEDTEHAYEQAEDAYPGCELLTSTLC